jgi:hypothetical protein
MWHCSIVVLALVCIFETGCSLYNERKECGEIMDNFTTDGGIIQTNLLKTLQSSWHNQDNFESFLLAVNMLYLAIVAMCFAVKVMLGDHLVHEDDMNFNVRIMTYVEMLFFWTFIESHAMYPTDAVLDAIDSEAREPVVSSVFWNTFTANMLWKQILVHVYVLVSVRKNKLQKLQPTTLV